MAWRFVKQPNGLLARFSEVVDDFTEYDMSVSDALEYCKPLMGTLDANGKVDRALADDMTGIGQASPLGDGLDRFRDAIATIKQIHGYETALERERELSKQT
jgi:hypothetical protein